MRGWLLAGHALCGAAIDALEGENDEISVTAYEISRSARAIFSTLLGRPADGAAESAEALNNLPESTDLVIIWFAVESYALGNVYVGNIEAVVEVLEEWIHRFDDLQDKVWVGGLKNYLALARIFAGDFETADMYLTETMEVYERADEHWNMTWNLMMQAMVAMGNNQPEAAAALYTRQIRRSEEIEYLRGLQVGNEGLGDANAAAGRLDEADSAFVRAVSVAEQMGMIREVLNIMTKIAGGRASMGRHAEAVEILAAVRRNPKSEQQALASYSPIRVVAAAVLEEIRAEIDTDVYEAAHTRGETESFDSVLNDLLGRSAGSSQVLM
jgi:tetratricopeptide (TPR) repeat protein